MNPFESIYQCDLYVAMLIFWDCSRRQQGEMIRATMLEF